ncbi:MULTISPECIES: cell division protein FtsZ [unclassified Campylobacter]|uniref:cell division protein FtsZ n=1 Tax=unclassified Campylobacter TaxID=2593542 RepID=UPI001BD9DF46|nr:MULTISPECIES: cell division protein FtsZ [unclassified Campylobacter]MBZ7975932.1 cell division protein FtsZ [Campylobacter sp. RM12637]MBZ7979529.1 cell division protein FtsZ [Campylobacter sp. RM12642]MBZ7981154.1 cell division protein FtsZ [Campylobacter sp. RM12640]MBZ7982995.1 cell division protein FtsZ [Campylobacter sp. RM12647]MBZ7988713.1 cell division protein FtsZ [Campylobacter sp. RM12635]MBZ7990415.1 cell division protein FtsZ [Campylobacter sp. RM9331]MBZ7992132.1 cell divis
MDFDILGDNIDFKVMESEMDCGVKIKVIGVGGAGGNMINHIVETCASSLKVDISNVDIMIANTDIQDINRSKANIKIQLGPKKTNGRGAGANPEIGRISAEEVEDEIKERLAGTELLFIAEGLGGGTGTGAGPVIAKIAKSLGILVVSVATFPFSYEKARIKAAEKGLEELKKESDCVILIQNDKLKLVVPKTLNTREANKFANDVLVNAVTGIIKMLLIEADTNIDFADVTSVMSHRGTALMGMGRAEGENAIKEAYANAIDSPLLENYTTNLQDAKAMIVFFSYGENIPFFQLVETMEEISNSSNEDLNVFCGHVLDTSLPADAVEVTIIATGFDETRAQKAKIEQESKKREEELSYKIVQPEMQKVSGGTIKVDYKTRDFNEPAFVRNGQD